jgi:phage terminase large subunit-like protein
LLPQNFFLVKHTHKRINRQENKETKEQTNELKGKISKDKETKRQNNNRKGIQNIKT